MNTQKTAPPTRVSNANRLAFTNWASFDATLKNLGESIEDLNAWETALDFTSVRRHNAAIKADTTIDNPETLLALPEHELPDTYGSVLNEQGEVQVGDTIFVYKRGFVFGVPAQNTQLLAQVHNSQDSTFRGVSRGKFTSKVYTPQTEALPTWGRAYVYEYKLNGHTFRHTFDLLVTQERRAGQFDRVYIVPNVRFKFDYRFKNVFGQGSWRPAGEPRIGEMYYVNTLVEAQSNPKRILEGTTTKEVNTPRNWGEKKEPLFLNQNYFLYNQIGGNQIAYVKVSGGSLYQLVGNHQKSNNLYEGMALQGRFNTLSLNLTRLEDADPYYWFIVVHIEY